MNYRTGVWIVGIYGEVSSVLILGAHAIAAGYASAMGLITESEPFRKMGLYPIPELVFGGHDIYRGNLYEKIHEYVKANRVFDLEALAALRGNIEKTNESVRLGMIFQCGDPVTDMADRLILQKRESMGDAVARIGADILDFKRSNNLDRVVVVNLSSAEPDTGETPPDSLEEWEILLKEAASKKITSSMLYAYAAFQNGFPYINFTPSAGSSPTVLQDFALQQGIPHYGNDGKTGETLVKTALAPLFVYRNLEVMSWEGYNLLGNGDGRVLQYPAHKKAKLQNKEDVLPSILGYSPHSRISIDYVPSLKDWKTAWDFIHFKGFLDTQMSIQFTWQGCDSVLAAPLVLDLIRLTDFADSRGEKGLMKHLSCFFKHPLGITEHRLSNQYEALTNYAEKHS